MKNKTIVFKNRHLFPNTKVDSHVDFLTINTQKGLRGALTPSVSFTDTPNPCIHMPFFAPGLFPGGYQEMFQYANDQSSFGSLVRLDQIPVGNLTSASALSSGVLEYDFTDLNGNPVAIIRPKCLQHDYVNVMEYLKTDMLRVSNIRLNYHIKDRSGFLFSNQIIFFTKDIFGTPVIESSSLANFFDPLTNKTDRLRRVPHNEYVDIPVDFIISKKSGFAIPVTVDCDDFSMTITVSKVFEHDSANIRQYKF